MNRWDRNVRDAGEIANDIDELLAEAFFVCNISFVVIENEIFRNLIAALCATNINYRLRSRKYLAGPILARVANKAILELRAMFNGDDGIMQADGWKNKPANRKNIGCTVSTSRVRNAFLTSRDVSLMRETAQNVAGVLQEIVDEAMVVFDVDIRVIITDNDARMIAAVALVTNPDGGPMIHVTCSSHSGNLLMKSIMPPAELVSLKELLHTFKDTLYECLLTNAGGTRLRNHPETRFCYARDSLESVSNNLQRLRDICLVEEDKIPQNVIDILFDDDFERWMHQRIAALTPVSIFINMCRNPNRNVADAVDGWLSSRIPTNPPGVHDDLLRDRIERAIQPPGFLAYILHPWYQGHGLSDEQIQTADDYLRATFDQNVIDEYDHYIAHRDEYRDYANRTTSALGYWIILRLPFPNLARIATLLMITPASTAVVEGLFSACKCIHSYVRNKLSSATTRNLLTVYYLRRHCMIRNHDDGLMMELDEQ